ncbi:DUF262 domain-containing protein [Methanobacterium sp. SMA-27]|uniref:DUF262 domain-containing protein n=1 Tax=Methanobacterium sp. SMA-27 TaxID=1495336 RepID=UPI00064FC144|nr:DUF262 domain-containing protein [Methanobacterium sp. SMA-27]
MNADAVPLHKILSFNLQMIIPIFQREYSWEWEEVSILWEDILKLYKNVYESNIDTTHFLGPIVRVERPNDSVDIERLWLIDGQQRIITLMVLLACIRNADPALKGKIEFGYFFNQEEEGDDYYKLIPSEGDRDNFRAIIDGDGKLNSGKLQDTFNYFTQVIAKSKDLDLEKLRGLILKKLILVDISVDKNENPYIIFESLNAKGTPLTQADLIRNYIFMRIGDEKTQISLYNRYWRQMEISLGKNLEYFFWRYTLKEGTFVKIKRTYANLKSELETQNTLYTEEELKKLHEYSSFYKKIIEPEKETNTELRRRLLRHNRWEIGTEYPFLLNIYKDYDKGAVTSEEFCELLDIIESFVIRRLLSAGYHTNKLNQLFIRLYSKLDHDNLIESLKKILYQDFPDDREFREGIKFYPIYSSGTKKCSMMLETLEYSIQHKEKELKSKLQIEHVMPQAGGESEDLPDSWKNMLGSNYAEIHRKYLHTLGNLTLTGYNQELGQKSFKEKKEIYNSSKIDLNEYFNTIDDWNEEEILKRSDIIADMAINIWKNINDNRSIDEWVEK